MERTRIPLPLAGGCQCGAVRYEIAEAPITLYACHCTECQRQSSSAFGMSMPVPRSGFAVTRGEPALWQRAGDSGRVVRCAFCPTCGTRLFHMPERNPAIVNVKPGTLDDTRWLEPVGHLWTRSRQRWISVPAGAVVFEGQPPDFSPLYQAWTARFE
ncbi:MAG TPA: GFA family protein [Candidatus Binatia bacterium]|nr:GFA family protein [Candidatus Binatia bacterium]